MDLMQIIQSQLTDTVMDQLAGQIGGNRQQTSTATSGILNALVGAMSKNAAKEDGASSLFNALDKDHDGSLLDNLTDFINPEAPNPVNERSANGLGIIGHLLGDKAGAISQLIGQNSGLSSEGAMGLMAKLAPIVMATLGKQKQQSGFDVTDLMGLLTNQGQQIRQQQQQQEQQQGGMGNLLKMLDFDGDGSGLDDAMGMLGKLFKK